MRFNLLKKHRNSADTLNLAGGEAFTESAQLELASIMLTSTLRDQFYRGADATAARLKALIAQIAARRARLAVQKARCRTRATRRNS